VDTQASESVHWILEEWASRLQEVVQSMTDIRPDVRILAPQAASSLDPDPVFWQELSLNLTAETALIVGASERSWFGIGEMALKAVGLETVDAADARNTYLEIINQSTSMVAQAIGRRLSREVSVMPGKELTETPGVILTPVELTAGDLAGIPVLLGISPALESLFAASLATPQAESASPQPGPAEQAGIALPPTIRSKTLDLLMEVELPISVSFGRTRLQLRDVLKLTSGSIVELNRTVTEPVEIIINGAVIARGEVVVVEGNYGVRIDQIISRQERLRTLK
jgi:flagellar motor switch protein FliN